MTDHDRIINKQFAFSDCEFAIAQLKELKAAIVGDHVNDKNLSRLYSAISGARDAIDAIEGYINRRNKK